MNNESFCEYSRALGELLQQKNKKITTAESCTGGGIACAITETAGSSSWFERAFVTYSNDSKIEELQVKSDTLNDHGAVSIEVVRQMALGAKRKARADCAIAVSGIAGPSGGTDEKPIGLVCFAIVIDKDIHTFEKIFKGSRADIRGQTIITALKKLIDRLVSY